MRKGIFVLFTVIIFILVNDSVLSTSSTANISKLQSSNSSLDDNISCNAIITLNLTKEPVEAKDTLGQDVGITISKGPETVNKNYFPPQGEILNTQSKEKQGLLAISGNAIVVAFTEGQLTITLPLLLIIAILGLPLYNHIIGLKPRAVR